MNLKSTLQNLNEIRERFGFFCVFIELFDAVINRFIYFDRLHIIVLQKENLKAPRLKNGHNYHSRPANEKDLESMQKNGNWDIHKDKIESFKDGNICLLSEIDDQIAGYAWVHSNNSPQLLKHFKISIPSDYIYNYAAFTHPKYRGYGLQSYRHSSILKNDAWPEKKGLIGFVKYTNWASQKGQTKSGYTRIGTVTLIGSSKKFRAFFTTSLKKRGIKRTQ